MTETRTEYAVRYDAPADLAGIVVRINDSRALVELVARQEERHPAIRCTVVERTVTYGEWEPVQ